MPSPLPCSMLLSSISREDSGKIASTRGIRLVKKSRGRQSAQPHNIRIKCDDDKLSGSLLHEVHVTVPLEELEITHPVKI